MLQLFAEDEELRWQQPDSAAKLILHRTCMLYNSFQAIHLFSEFSDTIVIVLLNSLDVLGTRQSSPEMIETRSGEMSARIPRKEGT